MAQIPIEPHFEPQAPVHLDEQVERIYLWSWETAVAGETSSETMKRAIERALHETSDAHVAAVRDHYELQYAQAQAPDTCPECLRDVFRLTDGVCGSCWAETNGQFGVGA